MWGRAVHFKSGPDEYSNPCPVELERPTARAASSSRRGPCWVEIDDTSPIPSRARRSTTVARCAALTSVRGANTKAIRGVAGAVMSGACITPPFNCRRPF